MSEESTPAMYGAPAFPVADTPDSDDDEVLPQISDKYSE